MRVLLGVRPGRIGHDLPHHLAAGGVKRGGEPLGVALAKLDKTGRGERDRRPRETTGIEGPVVGGVVHLHPCHQVVGDASIAHRVALPRYALLEQNGVVARVEVEASQARERAPVGVGLHHGSPVVARHVWHASRRQGKRGVGDVVHLVHDVHEARDDGDVAVIVGLAIGDAVGIELVRRVDGLDRGRLLPLGCLVFALFKRLVV